MDALPLKVAFLWHMHQPYYRNPRTGVYRLPWVRLHTVKDYNDMVVRLDAFPGIKSNFNLVPCLMDQIRDYAAGGVQEIHLNLSMKRVDELSDEEKVSLIRHFFLGNRKTMIEPYPRYRSLLEKCIALDSEFKVQTAVKKLSAQDFLDLQVWCNLAWIGPVASTDPFVESLRSRERGFTETMKTDLLRKHMEIMESVLGKYRQLQEEGRIEISMSPYFHPILPLLCDSDSASVSKPGTGLPVSRFRFPEDARAQIESGLRLHEEIFGKTPVGMWPPESAVSEEALELACECGIKWVAVDEGILEASSGATLRDAKTGEIKRGDILYRPHRFKRGGGEALIFFRDRVLSDLIGFEYADWSAREAVTDFVGRLEGIRKGLGKKTGESVVLVALDGENCWEFYDRGGDTFLNLLYGALSEREDIETVLLSDLLDMHSEAPPLESVYPGSWINCNLTTWIGHPEDNDAWDLLQAARTELKTRDEDLSEEKCATAWRSVHAAEGSDWFWWYGEKRTLLEDREFDTLFRAHLRHIYESAGAHVPHKVLEPIMAPSTGMAIRLQPAAVIRPVLDGKVTTFYEWKLAGLYESYRDSEPVIFGSSIVDAVYFGFDHKHLFLRIDTKISPQAIQFAELSLRLEFEDPAHRLITLRAPEARSPAATGLIIEPADAQQAVTAVALEIVEVAVPFDLIEASPGDTVTLRVAVLKEGKPVERRPIHTLLTIKVPRPDFEAENWSTL
ncbi:MAG: glycoside hydrolase family 57 protein [Candidatus Eisenbacteria bacterium]